MPPPTQIPGSSAVSPFHAGLACKCPRCGTGRLFVSAASLVLRSRCDSCGLDYSFADSGDGPAVFAILILGFVVLGLALFVQFRFDPPLWLLLAIATPVTLGLAFGLLRPMKATLVALQYKNKAGLGRPDRG